MRHVRPLPVPGATDSVDHPLGSVGTVDPDEFVPVKIKHSASFVTVVKPVAMMTSVVAARLVGDASSHVESWPVMRSVCTDPARADPSVYVYVLLSLPFAMR
jgi:hypothetical protein